MTKVSSLCVYCGASSRVSQVHRDAASELGRQLAKRGIRLVFGGGRVGLMGLVADAAIAAGGATVGIIPTHLHDLEVGHSGVDELIVVGSMHERKQRMFELSDAFAVLPGGLGTLDETFEVITWKQLRLHDKPVVLIDVEGYWQPLLALIENGISAGYVRPDHRHLYSVVSRVEDLFAALAAAPVPTTGADSKWL
ncbi:MAG: TIGR00730 family Rossman fold protein [Alphaproteobacteria bacterium]|nr:TIGR00730 family Rossman fold protein [Alphaproteobacteria bacterium]